MLDLQQIRRSAERVRRSAMLENDPRLRVQLMIAANEYDLTAELIERRLDPEHIPTGHRKQDRVPSLVTES